MRLRHHFRTRFGQEGIGFFIKVMHWLCQISVIELILWFPLISKYNFLCKRIGRIVHRHSSQICQNLSCCPVSLDVYKRQSGLIPYATTISTLWSPSLLLDPLPNSPITQAICCRYNRNCRHRLQLRPSK